MAKKLQSLTEALDQVSWWWVVDNHPVLAGAIEEEVRRGALPGEIRRHVITQTQRVELALRCEQATRFLATQEA